MASMYACVRCGNLSPAEHCEECDRAYYTEQQEHYDAGEPYPHQVGTAFGGPVCIMVHERKEHCGCRGGGWHNTDLDSWHECPKHYNGQTHPEYA